MKKILFVFLIFSNIIFSQVNQEIVKNRVWEGVGYQQDINESWSIKLTQEQDSIFTIQYPSLNCSGNWKIKYPAGSTIILQEEITIGKDICIPSSNVFLTFVPDEKLLSVIYKNIENDTVYAFGILHLKEGKELDTIISNEVEKQVESAKYKIEKNFSKTVYDPLFSKHKIEFDCDKCEAPTMEMQVTIDNKGNCTEIICPKLNDKIYLCKKITPNITIEMKAKFISFFKNYKYPAELRNRIITFYLRPEYLLKC